ncbi:MAG TPA: hypothetical protein VLE51_01140 [Candidatus Saccharimonadales bacterium]|nr:hypothetical protein [Candidatus Saccharimonadales bacterium]
MTNILFGDGKFRTPHSGEAQETAENDILMPLLEIVPADAFDQARNRWMDRAPSAENFMRVIGATALVAAKKDLITSGSVDRRLDFYNLLVEHPELQDL